MPQITLNYTRRIRMEGLPEDHVNAKGTFQVLQEATDENPFMFVRHEDTGEIGFIALDLIESDPDKKKA